MTIAAFQKTVWEYYREHKRDLPWRRAKNPYHIFVSEVMLQQTQVDRVVKKYPEFIRAFPDIPALARAPLQKVFRVWQGMGYNRRALHLKRSAEIMVKEYGGMVPQSLAALEQLPGIGPATARSIAAFAFNAPVVFIETNIRSVFINAFFLGKKVIRDKDIMPFVEKALERGKARAWYSALMDYGSMLKKTAVNPSRRSAHYARQAPFKGSSRELRGKIVKVLAARPATISGLLTATSAPRAKLDDIMRGLIRDGLIKKRGGVLYL